jgi:hypothetical protein
MSVAESMLGERRLMTLYYPTSNPNYQRQTLLVSELVTRRFTAKVPTYGNKRTDLRGSLKVL